LVAQKLGPIFDCLLPELLALGCRVVPERLVCCNELCQSSKLRQDCRDFLNRVLLRHPDEVAGPPVSRCERSPACPGSIEGLCPDSPQRFSHTFRRRRVDLIHGNYRPSGGSDKVRDLMNSVQAGLRPLNRSLSSYLLLPAC